MESVRDMYTIGFGPSSSHTMGPQKAAEEFMKKFPHADYFKVILYSSLAATGKGHLTDQALYRVLGNKRTSIEWKPDISLPLHPNGMEFFAYQNSVELGNWKAYSVGGGTIRDEHNFKVIEHVVYEMNSMAELLDFCDKTGRTFWEIVDIYEDNSIWDYLEKVWQAMKNAIHSGLNNEGVLPGNLKIPRKAASYNMKANHIGNVLGGIGIAFSYALAVAEENASGNTVVTAPTCGSAGVLPAVLLFLKHTYQISDVRIIRAIATAGLIGNIIKTNASISGAEVGCQGEIGTACAMASGAAAQLLGGSPAQIEYAAEMGMEHHLGLTCDPIGGYVQIPCIERNAIAAARSLDCASYSLLSDGKHRITFDQVVETMGQTGRDLQAQYRETSLGGLAREWTGYKLNKDR